MLLKQKLVNRGKVIHVGGGGNTCERLKVSDKMRLIEVAAFVGDGGKRLVVFGDQFQAVLETEDLVECRR